MGRNNLTKPTPIKSTRTAVFVSQEKLRGNVRKIREKLPPTVKLMAVIKGNAYGHGIEGAYQILKDDADMFVVGILEEGVLLRKLGFRGDILVLGDIADDDISVAVSNRLSPSIFSLEKAQAFSEEAAKQNLTCRIHIKIDTGMSRIGFTVTDEHIAEIVQISGLPKIQIVGCFTHFAKADDLSSDFTSIQLSKLMEAKELLEKEGVDIPLWHSANSPATLLRPDTYLDGVRVGDAIFGLCPISEDIWEEQELSEVMTWESYVSMVKEVPSCFIQTVFQSPSPSKYSPPIYS